MRHQVYYLVAISSFLIGGVALGEQALSNDISFCHDRGAQQSECLVLKEGCATGVKWINSNETGSEKVCISSLDVKACKNIESSIMGALDHFKKQSGFSRSLASSEAVMACPGLSISSSQGSLWACTLSQTKEAQKLFELFKVLGSACR